MANRVIGNVIIIDSAMGNAFVLNSANMPVHITKFHVNSIAFWSSDTTGRLVLSEIDTTNHLVSMGWTGNGTSIGFNGATQFTSFGDNQMFENLKVPTLTAGTAWIYLA